MRTLAGYTTSALASLLIVISPGPFFPALIVAFASFAYSTNRLLEKRENTWTQKQ